MFMEAVRLSLASEEDRKRKEEKALRKEAKKREKEEKKEEKKAAKKQGTHPYGGGSGGTSGSSLSLSAFGRRRGNSAASNLRMEATVQGATNVSRSGDSSPTAEVKDADKPDDQALGSKGKGVDRGPGLEQPAAEASSTSAGSLPIPGNGARGGSHLRQMSNASSVGSSVAESPSGSYPGLGFQGGDASNRRASAISLAGQSEDGDRDGNSEPLFNFRSLAEIVGVNIDDGSARADDGPDAEQNAAGGPLPQVVEDEKEEAEAEHVEGPKSTLPATVEPSAGAEGGAEQARPVTLEAPSPGAAAEDEDEDAARQDKHVGHSSVTEQTARVTQ